MASKNVQCKQRENVAFDLVFLDPSRKTETGCTLYSVTLPRVPRLEVYKNFKLNSTEYKICPAHKCKKANNC